MYGDELLDPEISRRNSDAQPFWYANHGYRESHCFLGVLGQRYQVATANFGWPGSSLQSAVWNFLYWLQHETDTSRCLVLFGLTDASRTSFWNPAHKPLGDEPPWNRQIHSAWVHDGADWLEKPWRDMIKLNTVLTQCPDLVRLNYLQTVLTIDAICQQRRIPCLQFNLITRPPQTLDVTTLIWPESCLQDYVNELAQTEPVHCAGRHPNELGHCRIADRLQQAIARVTIVND